MFVGVFSPDPYELFALLEGELISQGLFPTEQDAGRVIGRFLRDHLPKGKIGCNGIGIDRLENEFHENAPMLGGLSKRFFAGTLAHRVLSKKRIFRQSPVKSVKFPGALLQVWRKAAKMSNRQTVGKGDIVFGSSKTPRP